MGARFKSRNDNEIAIGWQSERFAREKRIKPLDEYLKPLPPPELRSENAAHGVKRMFDRMIAKQKKEAS